jgi:hypothetical protein
MKKITLALLMLFCITTFAQQGINYKTLVKYNGGEVCASTEIRVLFKIYQVGISDEKYQELHVTTTDVNGYVDINIGKGHNLDPNSANFDSIDWGSHAYKLNTTIATAYVEMDMGTTDFKPVPNTNNGGLVDLLNNGGLVKVGRDATHYASVGREAVDLSYSDIPGSYGATGNASTAMGFRTTASGPASTAMGNETRAEAYVSTAIGHYNTGGGTPNEKIPTDPLFEIGNGQDNANRTNALTVLRNGTILAPTFDTTEITDAKALVTKEYADANYMGLVDSLNNGGLVKVGRDATNYGSVGIEAVDLSYSEIPGNYGAIGYASTAMGGKTIAGGAYSIAMGKESFATGTTSTAMGAYTKASSEGSTAMGFRTTASSNFSTAMGSNTTASGNSSTAMGAGTTASGNSSTAMGAYTKAEAYYSTAMGAYTKAEAYASTAIGIYNTGGGNPIVNEGTNPLFEIGNGQDNANRTNALTVLRNGTILAPTFDTTEITDAKALVTKEYADANYMGTINNGGLVKVGRDAAYYGNIGSNAVDLSTSFQSGEYGATGSVSTAMGINTTASGEYATAMGVLTMASGVHSTAIGDGTTASGEYSTAMGYYTRAEAFGSTVIGRYNTGRGNPNENKDTNPLFEIGNGEKDKRTNALTVLKNGTILAPTFDATEITDAKALVTKEYADAQDKAAKAYTDAKDAVIKAYVDEVVAKYEARIKVLEGQLAAVGQVAPASNPLEIGVLTTPLSTSASNTVAVGDIRSGGIVFWVDPKNNTKGKVYAPANAPNILNWDAAKTYCKELKTGGYDDWWLPTKEELNQFYEYSKKNYTGWNNNIDYYWSSTEDDVNNAWSQSFSYGNQSILNKVSTASVRAVRAF